MSDLAIVKRRYDIVSVIASTKRGVEWVHENIIGEFSSTYPLVVTIQADKDDLNELVDKIEQHGLQVEVS